MDESDQNRVAETLNEICREANHAGLEDFILIGGNAVIAHGVPRFTRDVDFAIPERETMPWRQFLESRGFSFIHQTHAFAQFEDNDKSKPRVDLMIVDEATWDQLAAGASELDLKGGAKTRLALAEHIIAMKLRAFLSPHRRPDALDWRDIVELVLVKNFDLVNDREFRDLVLQFGNESLLEKLIDDIAFRNQAENQEPNHEG